jgi:hypothetical protein
MGNKEKHNQRILIHHFTSFAIKIKATYVTAGLILGLSLRLLGNGVLLVELDADGVYAMTLVRWGMPVALSLEDMSQVAAAVAADNLSTLHAEGSVGVSCDCSRYGIEKGRPATT